jgi:MFS transporter, ACS family, solute carrier family 17 (sodium-dependent inorganic phosphate cotransporter), member 6/7/8
MPKPGGYQQMDGEGAVPGGGGMYDDENAPESPMSFEELERPPLRHIDKYTKAECPCLSQRYTIALMACLGFIISFGMRCNMGMAKLQLEHKVSSATDSIIFN